MKRILVILLCACLLSVPALAVDRADYEIINEDGSYYFDEDGYNSAVAAEKVMSAGLTLDVTTYWKTDWLGNSYFDNEAFEADYAAALDAIQAPVESESVDNGITDISTTDQSTNDTTSDSGYPIGSYIDEAGNVFSPEGELLSSGTTPASDPDTEYPFSDVLSDGQDTNEDSGANTLPTVYTVSDLRSADSDTSTVEVGLKALIISIFGEYTPVTTTSTVTETVDNVTTTTLIDTVAEGAAGVDYEWLAGVFLFGILLFCLMKLLGGILK